MKKILAVSGGIDSMVLFDQFKNDPDAIVAHFNHGTRPSADDDQKFVASIAKKYRRPFYTEKQNLGANVSEEQARAARYEFLQKIAKTQNGKIYTAHHADDLAESIAINLIRGTGWRGLIPLDNAEIVRPMLHYTKTEILEYAATHQITFREDPTNTEEKYLRNRLRPLLKRAPEKPELIKLSAAQKELKSQIDQIVQNLLPKTHIYQRAWFNELPDEVAIEILRAGLAQISVSATRPKIQEFLTAIRTYAPEKSFNLPGNRLVKLHKTYFTL